MHLDINKSFDCYSKRRPDWYAVESTIVYYSCNAHPFLSCQAATPLSSSDLNVRTLHEYVKRTCSCIYIWPAVSRLRKMWTQTIPHNEELLVIQHSTAVFIRLCSICAKPDLPHRFSENQRQRASAASGTCMDRGRTGLQFHVGKRAVCSDELRVAVLAMHVYIHTCTYVHRRSPTRR
jgi:hypothetical protein